jgi:hypothetical protein
MAKGGARPGSGRKKNPAKELAPLGEQSAAKVLKELEHEKALVGIYRHSIDDRLKVHIIMKLREWAYGKPVQELRVANKPGEKLNVNVTSEREKLIAALSR